MHLRKMGVTGNRTDVVSFVALLLIFLSVAFSIRFLNSILVIALLAIPFLYRNRKAGIKKAFRDPYFICLALLYLLQVGGMIYTDHPEEGLRDVALKTGMVTISFFFCAGRSVPARNMWWIMLCFSIALGLVSLWCLVHASIGFARTNDFSLFFYHQLVIPVKHHAILFSFFIFYVIVYWMEKGWVLSPRPARKF
jgi:hypothetical protein